MKFIAFLILFSSCVLLNKQNTPYSRSYTLSAIITSIDDFEPLRVKELQNLFEQPIQSATTLDIKLKEKYLGTKKYDFVKECYEFFTDSIYLHTFIVIRDGDPIEDFDSVCASKYVSKLIFYQDTLLVKKDIVNDGSSKIPYNWTIADITEVTLQNNDKYFVVCINEEPYNGNRTPCRDIVIDANLKTMRLGKDIYWRQ